jgi:uncharacterized protein
MSKKNRVKPASARPIWPLQLLFVALGMLAWLLLRPLPHGRHQRHLALVATATPAAISLVTASPSASPAETLAPSAAPSGGARLAIIIDDCGQWLGTERAFIALPVPLTLSILPDVRYTRLVAAEAAAAGKGVMLHLPMETVSGLNPGPGKVTTEMSDAQIETQVEADLAQVPFAQGVNNHEGSKATASERVMRDVARALAEHGSLFFVDSMTSGDSVAAATMRGMGLPTGTRDVFLDNRANVAYTEAQLQQAAEIARRDGSAIAIGHPRPTTLAALRALIPQLQAQGVHLVLVSQLLGAPLQPSP